MHYFLVLTNGDAAALIAIVAGAVISGAFLYAANHKPKEGRALNYGSEKVGEIAVSDLTERFRTLERMHLWTLFVLVGQGLGFFYFTLFIRQELRENVHNVNDRLDRIEGRRRQR